MFGCLFYLVGIIFRRGEYEQEAWRSCHITRQGLILFCWKLCVALMLAVFGTVVGVTNRLASVEMLPNRLTE